MLTRTLIQNAMARPMPMFCTAASMGFARTVPKLKEEEKTAQALQRRQQVLRKQLSTGDKVTFSNLLLKTPAEELRKRRQHIRAEHGFTEEEIRFIARQKPNFLMYDKDESTGITALSELLISKYGATQDLVRTLVLKHPSVLGLSTQSIEETFDQLRDSKGIDYSDSLKLVFDVPALLSLDIAARSAEIEELFHIYHKIEVDQVTQIFKDFPYLYCCPSKKL